MQPGTGGGGPINARTGKPYGASTQAYADWAATQGKPVLTDEQSALHGERHERRIGIRNVGRDGGIQTSKRMTTT